MFQLINEDRCCTFSNGMQLLRIAFATPSTARISYIEGSEFVDKVSAIVTADAPCEEFDLVEHDGHFSVTTKSLKIRVSKATGAIGFWDTEGRLLQQEPEMGGKQLTPKQVFRNIYDNTAEVATGQSIDGARAEAQPSETVLDRHAFEAKLSFTFADDEALFGLGSHEEGYGNLRGKSQDLYQQNMKAVVPCFVSTKGYGILLDASCLMTFHDDAEGSYLWAETVDQLDYYFIAGEDASAVARGYYQLTGAPPMLPRWAFGYMQSKERYINAAEMLEVAREYRRRKIPLDLMVLDWKSWPDGSGWGQKSFDPARFPDPAGFLAELHAMDVKLMVSIWPIMTGGCPNQLELDEKGLMLGNGATYDALNPEARKTYWQQTNDGLFAQGVDAWWCDCTEPFEADWGGAVKPEPKKRMGINTEQAKRYLDEGHIVAYSLFHSQGIYEGQRKETHAKRVINLTRSSHAGQHRYATVSWSGDICATWDVLRKSIPEGVNFCATGEPYWTVDIGAFFLKSDPELWFWSGDYEAGCRGLGPMDGPNPDPNDTGCTDLGYWELYTRWLQYGCFLPVFRSHGTDAPREIWCFGDEGNPFYDSIAKFIRLRYQLLPYIYSVAAEVGTSGLALLRPVAMAFPHDCASFNLTDQYLFGLGLMVCPVTTPMYYERGSTPLNAVSKTRKVYLPEGKGWYDFWTGTFLPGGQTITAEAPLETMPLYAPAGSILLMGAVCQNASQPYDGPIEIRIYTGADASFIWYEDAGDNYDYEQGQCARVTITWNEATQTLQLSERNGSFDGLMKSRPLKIHCYSPKGITTSSALYEGAELAISCN